MDFFGQTRCCFLPRTIRSFCLTLEDPHMTANNKILTSEQVETLMIHFSGDPDWAKLRNQPKNLSEADQTNNYAAIGFGWME
jgi:hypothetical protein